MQVNKLIIERGNKRILNNISFSLNSEDKVGLVGINGCGKSTLLKSLSGNLKLTEGTIKYNDETIGYLEQEIPIKYYENSVIEYIKEKTNFKNLEQKLHELENDLNESNMDLYGDVLNEFLAIDGYNFESHLNEILNGLNFKESIDKKVCELSGGEKIKVLLAILLLQNKDILLLDEPTNNLDIEAIEWLENYLKRENKKMIIVSHDEVFLDKIVNKIFEIKNGELKEYNVPYRDYLKMKELEYKKLKDEYENAQMEKEKLKNKLATAIAWSEKGNNKKAHNDNDKLANNYAKEKTNNSNVSKISKALDKVEVPIFKEKEDIKIFFNVKETKGNKDIVLSDLICGYNNFQTDLINLNIKFGLKVQISGSNGSGKTTLINTIMGKLSPKSGNIYIGNDAKIGYISQDTLSMDCEETIYEYITNGMKEVNQSLIFTLLNKLGISYEDKNKKYSTLSPGERTRVNIAKLAMNKINILILDEVTNHLDSDALNLIYELVESFDGTIISISHNRKYNEILNADIILNLEDIKNNKQLIIKKN